MQGYQQTSAYSVLQHLSLAKVIAATSTKTQEEYFNIPAVILAGLSVAYGPETTTSPTQITITDDRQQP